MQSLNLSSGTCFICQTMLIIISRGISPREEVVHAIVLTRCAGSEEDKRRFTELYEENHVRAEQTALRILRDPHDAEDAVQNAFLQVIHHFDEISEIPCKKLGFWIISIVKNEALMILRRKQKELPQEDWDTFSADVSDPTSYNELVQLFSQLPPTYRAALEMRLINGYSGKEIAQHLGISESAVNTRISRGRALLREIAVKEGFHI